MREGEGVWERESSNFPDKQEVFCHSALFRPVSQYMYHGEVPYWGKKINRTPHTNSSEIRRETSNKQCCNQQNPTQGIWQRRKSGCKWQARAWEREWVSYTHTHVLKPVLPQPASNPPPVTLTSEVFWSVDWGERETYMYGGCLDIRPYPSRGRDKLSLMILVYRWLSNLKICKICKILPARFLTAA